MADLDINNPLGVVDKRQARGVVGSNVMAEFANTGSVAAIKTRLQVIDPVAFTTARLHSMTENDLIYALRLRSADAAGI